MYLARGGGGGEDFFRIIFDDLFAGNAGRRGIFFFCYSAFKAENSIFFLDTYA